VKEKKEGEHSYEVRAAGDELDHAMLRGRQRGQPFVLIAVDIWGNCSIFRPRMHDKNFFRPRHLDEK